MKLPAWVTRAQAIWVAVGAFLIVLGSQGAGIPAWLGNLFSQATFDAILVVVGAVVTFYQYVRSIFAAKAEVSSYSAGVDWGYVINPFKV